ncbi:hypothetical protein J2847_006460 [Azospirillum agricola]|uniref:hypothetical protein n=1 Tax=Azospirillum agricola TaxID=1720247 RepID=UPI001AEA5F95|nr:hypothetical protein [Azospirillum agricola]MBP2233125.1 hypothetical protein [Azospirillum agricola]
MTAIPEHLKTVQDLCRIARRVYQPAPVPSATERQDAVRHMVATGRVTLDGYPCAPDLADGILAICRQRGWIVRSRLTAAARRQAEEGHHPARLQELGAADA